MNPTYPSPYASQTRAAAPDTAPLPPRDWPTMAARAGLTLALAAWLLTRPPASPAALTLLVALFMLAHGALALACGVREVLNDRHAGTLVFEGAMGLAAAVVALVLPRIATPAAADWATAAWALLSGAAMVATAVLRRARRGRAWLFAAGVLSVGWALFLMAAPTAGASDFSTWIGMYALLVGAALLGVAVQLVRDARGPSPSLGHLAW